MKNQPRFSFLSFRIVGFALLAQLLAATPASAERITLLGFWNFDSSRRAEYIASVKAQQGAGNFNEIAAQMGLGHIENSAFEFGVDPETRRPFMKIVDKATKKIETHFLKIEVTPGKELKMTDVDTGNTFVVKPTGNDKMLLIDNGQKLRIPLRRVND